MVVNGLERVMIPSPSPLSDHTAVPLLEELRGRASRVASGKLSITHSSPNDQPPITSLGQWTPSMTRLVPMSSDSRIANAMAGRSQRVPAAKASASVRPKIMELAEWPLGKDEVFTRTRCGSRSGRTLA